MNTSHPVLYFSSLDYCTNAKLTSYTDIFKFETPFTTNIKIYYILSKIQEII
jgi:hypothetical protein